MLWDKDEGGIRYESRQLISELKFAWMLKMQIKDIRDRMDGQGNLATAHPIYMVQTRYRVFGIDLACADNFVWVDSDEEIINDETELPESCNEESFEKVGVQDIWISVQPFFSRVGAEKYIEENRHNMAEPRIYVESAHRNDEWQAVRKHILDGASEDE